MIEFKKGKIEKQSEELLKSPYIFEFAGLKENKNYLEEKEIKNLNNLVNLFLDIAESNAERNLPMSMKDWKNEVETSLKLFHYEVLEDKGKISAEKAKQKAESEYEKYKIIQDKKFVSDFDKLLIETEKIDNH